MGFKDEVDTAQRENGGDFFKFREGDNKMRIMSEPVVKVTRFGYGICYEGAPYCQKATLDKELEEARAKAKAEGKDPSKVAIKMPSKKWECWALIRGNEEKQIPDVLAIVDLPYTVSTELRVLMDSDEAGFKSFPMPYDVNIKAKGAGNLDVKYSIIASRVNVDVTDSEMEEYNKQTPITQILDRMKDKKRKEMEGGATSDTPPTKPAYPEEDINPDDIPF